MPEAFRFDVGTFGQARLDHNGALITKGVMTRCGVFSYRHTDGSITRELRHPSDVFHPDALASLIQLPVTDDHPVEGRITAGNFKRYAVGNTGDSVDHSDGYTVKTDVIVRDQGTIDKVLGVGGQPKKMFLSVGYKADVIPEEGIWNDPVSGKAEKYDHRQTVIRGNHLSIVRNPRAGAVARMLVDAADAYLEDEGVVAAMVEQTITDSLELVRADDKLDAKQRDALSEKISKIAHEHPEWENDQVVAVAHKMLGLSKKDKGETGEKPEDKVEGPEADKRAERVTTKVDNGEVVHRVGTTSTGKPIWSNHAHPDHAHFTVREHDQAADAANRRAELASGAVAYHKAQAEYVEGDELAEQQEEIKRALAEEQHYRAQAKLHFKSANAVRDDADANRDDAPSDPLISGDDLVKIKRDAVTIGQGDSELRLDELVIEVNDESEPSIEFLLDERDTLITYAREQHADAERARGERDQALARIQDPTKLDELARERTDILEVADFVGLKRDDLKAIPNQAIKRQVVLKRSPELVKTDSTDDYVEGCYTMIRADRAQVQAAKDKHGKLADAVRSNRTDVQNAKPGADDDDDDKKKKEPTYREAAMKKMDGVAGLDDAQLKQRGFLDS